MVEWRRAIIVILILRRLLLVCGSLYGRCADGSSTRRRRRCRYIGVSGVGFEGVFSLQM